MALLNNVKEEVLSQNLADETVLDDQGDEFIMPSQSSERSYAGSIDVSSRVNPAFQLDSVGNEIVEETVIDQEKDDDSSYNLPTQDAISGVADSEDLFGTQTEIYNVEDTILGDINLVEPNIIIPETPLKQKGADDSILKTPRLSLLNSPEKYSISRKDQLLCGTESQVAETQPAGIDHTIVLDSDEDTPKKSSKWSSPTKSEKLGIFNAEWPGKDLRDVVGSVLGKDENSSQDSLSSLAFSPMPLSRGKFVYERIDEERVEVVESTCDESVLECIDDNDESTIQCTQDSGGKSTLIDISSDKNKLNEVALNNKSGSGNEKNDKEKATVVVESSPGTVVATVVEDLKIAVDEKISEEIYISDTEPDNISVDENRKAIQLNDSLAIVDNDELAHKEKTEIEISDADPAHVISIANVISSRAEENCVENDKNVSVSEEKINCDVMSGDTEFYIINENERKEVQFDNHIANIEMGNVNENRFKDTPCEKTISPENFHTAPETTPDTEAATAEAMPSPENDVSLSPAKEDSTPQILRKNYTFFLEVTGCVELCSNTNTLLKKEIIAVKDHSLVNSNCILESWSESTDKSKRESISSAGSVYSDKVGLPFTLKPRMSLASVQTSSTSTVEELPVSTVNKVQIDEIQPWKNDCLMAIACDEALVKQLTLNHLSRTHSREHKNKKKIIKRVSQANKVLFRKNENIDEVLSENPLVKPGSVSKLLPLDVPKITPLEKSTPIFQKTELVSDQKCIEETPVLAKETKNETPTGRKRGRAASSRKKGLLRTEPSLSETSPPTDSNPPAKKVAMNTRVPSETIGEERGLPKKRALDTSLGTPKRRKFKEVVPIENEGSAINSPIKCNLPTIAETKVVTESAASSLASVQRRLRSTSKSDATPPSTSSRTPRGKTPSSIASSFSANTSATKRSRAAIESSTDSSPGLKENNRRKKLSQLITNDLEYTPGLEMDETVVNSIAPVSKQTRGKSSKSKKKILEEPDDPEIIKRLGPIPDGPVKIFSGMGFILCYVKPRKRKPLKKSEATSNSDFSMSESEDFQLYDMHHNFVFDEARLRRQIIAGGGVIYDRFSHIPPSKYSSTKLVTNRPNRSAKFLLSFIYNIPIVLHLHIIEACRNGNFSAMKLYHIGWSEATQRWLDKPKQIHKTFADKSVYLHSKSEDSDADSLFVNFWTIVLEKAGAVITSDPNYADVIIADTSLPREIHGSVQALGSSAPTLVSINWAIESLLHGKLLNSTLHPSFAYDCSYASS